MTDEETVKPDLLGRVDDPNIRAELVNFKPPSKTQIKAGRRVMQVERWIEGQHRMVGDGEVLAYITSQFNVSEEVAKDYLARIVMDFRRIGAEVT